jgi:hypothetical protein
MGAMLGISLYSYPYLKLAKMLCLSYCLCLLFSKIGEEGRTVSAWKWRGLGGEGGKGQGGDMAQAMYAHLNKWTKKKKSLKESNQTKDGTEVMLREKELRQVE